MATFDEIVVGQGTAAEHGALVELALRAARGDAQAAEQLQRLTLERGVDAADVLRFLGSHEAFQALVIQQDVDREAIARLAEEHPALVRVALLRGLFLAAVEGRDERGIEQIAAMFERVYDFGLLLADAMDVTLQAWIDEAEARLEKACRIVLGLAPHDPSIEENQAVDEAV
ncbi:MAG: hypothetical protein JXD18_14280, partial [Anaerolineae bacterium]|nr:hypothetical protein [Anaerolineae bacterium]